MSTGVQTATGKFVWHDNTSTNVEKAKTFYTELFGWDTEIFKPGEIDYTMIKAGGQNHGGFGAAQGGAPSAWLGHVLVTDVDETVLRAEGAGGKLIAAPMDIPDVGRMAVIADPQGAVIAAFASAGDPPAGEGTFVWDELTTTDVAGAKSFYKEVFGWTSKDSPMGDMTYTIFQRAGDIDTAGCMERPAGVDAPPHWTPYIATPDVDETVTKAKGLDATIIQDATDIPNMGRFAIIQDPTGAVFGIWQTSGS
jgi:predicted enzyme related to lactoylglutathione lyase